MFKLGLNNKAIKSADFIDAAKEREVRVVNIFIQFLTVSVTYFSIFFSK